MKKLFVIVAMLMFWGPAVAHECLREPPSDNARFSRRLPGHKGEKCWFEAGRSHSRKEAKEAKPVSKPEFKQVVPVTDPSPKPVVRPTSTATEMAFMTPNMRVSEAFRDLNYRY